MLEKLRYFTLFEWILWSGSVLLTVGAFLLFDRGSWLSLAASLIGVTSLIFAAKGNPAGPGLMIVFSVLYGIISLSFRYYGEMVTYLGMTLPMSVFSLAAWLRHPYAGERTQVEVSRLTPRTLALTALLTAAVTAVFWVILARLGTANLVPSMVSVATSFAAAALTFLRSPYFALAYAANDGVLIVLWTLAVREDVGYLSVLLCFVVFLVNDLYGFVNWKRMARRQAKG